MGVVGPASAIDLRVTPNPTMGQTAVRIELDGSAQAGVQVFDVAGRLVREFPRMPLETGENLVRWDGKTTDGRTAPAGIYFFRVTTDNRLTRTARILVVR
jgi:flagellar hook assembly protein FlgD